MCSASLQPHHYRDDDNDNDDNNNNNNKITIYTITRKILERSLDQRQNVLWTLTGLLASREQIPAAAAILLV